MQSTVKSAARVFEVLEYFDRVRRAATATDIARALRYPQSSTSVLLRSLVELGYLEADAARRTYLPTPRVTLLGSWIEPLLVPGGEIMRLMDELGDETGETVILGVAAGDAVRYIHVVQGTSAMRLHVGPGTVRPMAISGMGRVFMSVMDADKVRRIVARYNAAAGADGARLKPAAVKGELATIAADGYAPSFDRLTPGAGGISMLLPVAPHGVPMALAIAGLSATISAGRERFVQLMVRGMRRHLRPASMDLKAA